MAALTLRLLGGFELEGAGRTRLPTRKAEALLAHLVMPAGRAHSRDKLASLLWGGWGDAKARHSLAQTLHLVRKTLSVDGVDPLIVDGRTVAVDASCIEVDVATFENLVAQQTTDALAKAAALYEGDFLDGIHIREIAFEAWLLGEQRRLHNIATDALEALLQHQFDTDEDNAAVGTALQLLVLEPSNESVHRTLMRLHCRTNRREAAIRQYVSCAELLRRELDIEPDEETTRLYREISNNRTAGRHRAESINDLREDASIAHPPPDMPSIAVLPYANLSHDPDQEYFADGIAEDLITALSKFRSFFVIARNSSFAYKGKEIAVSQIARELGVRYVVEGSVRKAEERVRITSQLIDAETNHHLWAENYDRDFRDIFDLQDEMTATIVGAIEPQLSDTERTRAKRKHPENLSAWDCYQRGLWHHLQRTKEDEEEAGRLFQNAIELDPEFSLAYAGLAEHFRLKIFFGWTNEPEKIRKSALHAAQKAVAADDKDPYAHCVLGRVYTMQGDYEAAISELEESLELNPNMALANFALGYAFTWFGRARDALPLLHKAIRQSPRDPQRTSMEMMIGYSYFMVREYDEAVEWLKKSSRRSAGDTWSHLGLAAAYVALQRIDDARAAINEALRTRPDLSLTSVAAMLRPRYTENNERYLGYLREAGLPE